MKKLCSAFLCLIMLFSFSACFDNSDKQETVKKTKLKVSLDFNVEKSVNSRVCFNTNLPVGTLLDVEIFIGDRYHSKETVAVQGDISENYFITESQRDEEGKDIADGNYILSVNLASTGSQPTSVKSVIGKNGEYLTGTYVYETENGKTVKLSNPLVKKDDKFTIPED